MVDGKVFINFVTLLAEEMQDVKNAWKDRKGSEKRPEHPFAYWQFGP
jgi:hypothetical protein